MASSLNDANLEKKLLSVSNTQESIQTLSLWCLHHKAHYKKIVEVWMKVVKKAKPSHKLALYYLANDVIQNSKRKGNGNFAEAWMPHLTETVDLMRDDKVKPQVERIFNVWEVRNIYDADFILELRSLISNTKVKPNTSAKVVAEFKPQKLVEKIKKFRKVESETDLKQKQLASLKLDITSTETLRQLKDRAHGNKFSQEFEDATNKLDEYVQALEKEVNERTSLIEILQQSEVFYDTQRGEAKIVANAYKNFGSRVKNLKKKLDDLKSKLPSPVPSPTPDAPSPVDSSEGNTPVHNSSKDNTEAVDMEMSDEEIGGTLRLEDPDDGMVTTPGSAPSPEGSPEGLNFPQSPSSETQNSGKENISVITNQLAQGPNVMTSLLDSMSGTVPATSRSGSLDSRLSNLMQNIPNLSPAIQSSLFGDQSNPNLSGLLTATRSATGNDGSGTPLKDEGSGTGSATPLQDEEREASNPLEFLNKVIARSSGVTASPADSHSRASNSGISAREKEESLQSLTSSAAQLTFQTSGETEGEKINIAEFLKKITSSFGLTPAVNSDSFGLAPQVNADSFSLKSQASSDTFGIKPQANNDAFGIKTQVNTDSFNLTPQVNNSSSFGLTSQMSSDCSKEWNEKPVSSQSQSSTASRWYTNTPSHSAPVYTQYNTSSPALPSDPTQFCGVPPPSSSPVSSAMSDGVTQSSTFSYNSNLTRNPSTDSSEDVSSLKSGAYNYNPSIPSNNMTAESSEDLPAIQPNAFNYGMRRNPEITDDLSTRGNVYGYKKASEYYSDDADNGGLDSLSSPPISRTHMKRNPNIVELTPSPTRTVRFNDADQRSSNSNLITLVQNNDEIASKMSRAPKTLPERTILRYGPNIQGPQPPPPPPGRPSQPNNLRAILPIEVKEGNSANPDKLTPSNDLVGNLKALVAEYGSEEEGDNSQDQTEPVTESKIKEELDSAPASTSLPPPPLPPSPLVAHTEYDPVSENKSSSSSYSKIETVGSTRRELEKRKFSGESDHFVQRPEMYDFNHRNEMFEQTDLPPRYPGHMYNYPRRGHWDPRNREPAFYPHDSFRPPHPKRFPFPRMDGRRPFFPRRY